jgi:hypothetical protein
MLSAWCTATHLSGSTLQAVSTATSAPALAPVNSTFERSYTCARYFMTPCSKAKECDMHAV